MTRKPRKRISKAYRTFLFKKRMVDIISLMLNADGTQCFFCGKKFTSKDFPLKGKDLVEIHHTNYIPPVKVLAHKKCHRKIPQARESKTHRIYSVSFDNQVITHGESMGKRLRGLSNSDF